ncbi:MAG TPA: S8 family serine peptidase [Aestuariivirgaceae bacterium]|nr:S8 family serine peptidase [Aestuariivirgaceae bacterium]
MRRFLVMLALIAMTVATAAPAAARERPDLVSATNLSPTEVIHANKSLSGRLAQSDADLLARRDGELVNVMVKFDLDSVASYRGDVQGLRATSPSITGKSLKENSAAVAAYRQYASAKAGLLRRAIKSRVADVRLGTTFLTAYGGVAARLPANRAKQLLQIEGVAAVQYDRLEQPLTDASPAFIGASSVWGSLGGSSTAGEGVIVGVLDTGIWPEHPSFDDPGIAHPGGSYGCDFGDGFDPDFGDDFTCNDKLIGAYAFVDTYLSAIGAMPGEFCKADDSACSARDANGHGTHTSSTAAGGPVASAVLLGVERGPISGIAPGAHVIMYRVCLNDGCFGSDSVAAVEQAITDGVDVINFSISGGSNAYSDPVELAFLDAYAAGITVNASAGNSGPGAATAHHAGPWTNTVGASTSNRHFLGTLSLTADGLDTLDITGATVTSGAGPAPLILAEDVPGYTDPLCLDPLPAGSATGMIVACRRGVIARVDKSLHVEPSGAAGMILYNPVLQGLNTDNHFIPSIHIDQPGSDDFLAFYAGHTGVMASFTGGTSTSVLGDVMASFSSRGPVGDFLKPDVTAPGVQILAGHSPEAVGDGVGKPGELFQAIAGTSMSSPHAAGVAALVKAAHPAWSPGQIKSAMMTSSLQSVLKEDGATPSDPFDRGAGSIRANRAVKPTVTFDVNPVDYYLSAGDPFGRIDLNLASVNVPSFDGVISTTRQARNVTGTTQDLVLSTSGGSGKISVSPSVLSLGPGQTKMFTVTINATALADGWYFGQIKLNPKKSGFLNAILPVAFNKEPGDVTLSNVCDSGTVEKGTEVECEVSVTNFASQDTHVWVRVKSKNPRKAKINDWSAGNQARKGFRWSGTLGPALGPEIIGLVAPGDGFFDTSPFLSPVAGFTDETITNFDLPAPMRFGDEEYDSFGVVSNGYIVVGGGEEADVDFVPHEFPDPVRPNNVLAPFWTDLNPADGGDIYVGAWGCGFGPSPCFYSIQWDGVPIWGTGGTATRTFQVWIMTAAFADFVGLTDDDYITFEYLETDMGAGAVDGLIVGAENRDATSGVDLGFDVGPDLTGCPDFCGYFLDTGVSTPGGTMTITYDLLGRRLGSTKLITFMTSDVTAGTAKRVMPITVVP